MTNTEKYNSSDDYKWERYNQDYYTQEMKTLSQSHIQVLKPDDYAFESGALVKKTTSPLCLHGNWHAVYEAILKIDPSSIAEVGSGGGDHVANLKTLLPQTNIAGYELVPSQREYCRVRHPYLDVPIHALDLTMPPILTQAKYDLVFTQAVIMHIKTASLHLHALANVFNMAKRYVVLMENWKHHNFHESIEFLRKRDSIGWENVFYYTAPCPNTKRPHALVVSRYPLDCFQELTNYRELTEHVSSM